MDIIPLNTKRRIYVDITSKNYQILRSRHVLSQVQNETRYNVIYWRPHNILKSRVLDIYKKTLQERDYVVDFRGIKDVTKITSDRHKLMMLCGHLFLVHYRGRNYVTKPRPLEVPFYVVKTWLFGALGSAHKKLYAGGRPFGKVRFKKLNNPSVRKFESWVTPPSEKTKVERPLPIPSWQNDNALELTEKWKCFRCQDELLYDAFW